jgi:hypothetical protein
MLKIVEQLARRARPAGVNATLFAVENAGTLDRHRIHPNSFLAVKKVGMSHPLPLNCGSEEILDSFLPYDLIPHRLSELESLTYAKM